MATGLLLPAVPQLPSPPLNYDQNQQSQLNNSLRLYLQQLNTAVGVNANSIANINSNFVNYTAPYSSAIATNVGAVLSQMVSVKDFGAVGDGVTNDTAAFAAARTVTNRYYIPNGTYVLDASPDPFLDCYTSGGSVRLIIGGTLYDCTNAFAGPLRYVAASATKTNIVHSQSNNIVQYWQDGGPHTATGFYRGLAVTTDSHWIQVQPATNGGETDLLFQRSTLNADPAGNRFNITFQENNDRLLFSYATSASGAPSFDTAMQIIAGPSGSLAFPALSLDMKQGYTIQTRDGGALRIQNYPTSDITQAIRDTTTGNVLQTTDKSVQTLAGVGMDTLLTTPSGVVGPKMWGGVFGDTGTAVAFPVAKNIWSTTGATQNQIIGTLRVAAQPSGSSGSYRESRFVFDGTTVTITDLVNTLPVGFVSTIAVSGTNLQFQGSYDGSLGGGYTVSVLIEWCGAGR